MASWRFVFLTLFMASILTLLPFPEFAIWMKPDWLLLIVLYWIFIASHHFNLVFAWLCGILMDVLSGSVLGLHAFAYLLIVYLMLQFHRQIRVFPPLQQAVVIFGLYFLYEIILIWMQGMFGPVVYSSKFWFTPFICAVLWPFIYGWLFGMRRRYAGVLAGGDHYTAMIH